MDDATASYETASRRRRSVVLQLTAGLSFRQSSSAAWKSSFDATIDAAGRSKEAKPVWAGYRPVLDEMSERAGEVSAKRLDVVTGDLIVLPNRRLDLDTVAVFEANPLWASLPAVQAGRVVALPNPVYNGGTYVAAELLLRAIDQALR